LTNIQPAAFEDFIRNFKSSTVEAADALDNLRLNEDAVDGDYDFMDDAEGADGQRNGQTNGQTGTGDPKHKYMHLLQQVANRKVDHITVDLDDIAEYESTLPDDIARGLKLVSAIEQNAKHYIEVLSKAVDKCLPNPSVGVTNFKSDVLDVVIQQRRFDTEMTRQRHEAQDQQPFVETEFPAELLRRYGLSFRPLTPAGSSDERSNKPMAIRAVKGEHLGHLITIRGIVTRATEVKPAVLVCGYVCDMCGDEIFQPVTTRSYTPLLQCPSDSCKKNNTNGQLVAVPRVSKFSPFQEVKIQEMADQVPVGHIPRQLTVHAYGGLVRQLGPGDMVDIAGIFLPMPYTGFKALKAGLLTDTYLEAQHVRAHKKAYEDMLLAQPTIRRMDELERSGQLYEFLTRSIAPEIFGHADVKKALLLQLIGGVTKEMGDGMKIRGDINICLMGDPGTAKSQLLKYISKVAPRGIYTTGRGSSGVGLTAAVIKDPVTEEMVLEGGALVLADNGTCCIDEFDKMDDGDRTAIHEVMEQQTISISKAGINTTLNARTSILAAANPLYGRYNPRLSPIENINLPAALLSRFDILFLILDTPSRDTDEELARHVAFVHMHQRHPPTSHGDLIFSPAEVRQWIARARTYRPVLAANVAAYLEGSYVRLRQQQKREEANSKQFAHTTPRTLLGLIRLAQALARLRFAAEVVTEDVDEALRLVEVSKASLYESRGAGGDQTPSSKIYHLIRAMAASGAAAVGSGRRGELSMARVRERVLAKGFTEDQFEMAVDEYSVLDVSILLRLCCRSRKEC